MKAVIMAGGEGSRLRPLTSTRPKPLVPVVNRPILWHVLRLLKKNGIENCYLTLHYLADQITSIFGDGADYGLSLNYSFEDKPLGTAGSVKAIENDLHEPFVIISGDVVTDFDISRLVAFHKKQGSVVTIGLARVQNPLEYGVVMVDDGGQIVRFLEKPGWSDVFSDTVNTGIYVIEPEALRYVDKEKPTDFSKDVFPTLLKKGESMHAFVLDGYWCDVGVPSQYIAAHHDILSGKTKVEIPGEQRSEGVWVDENSEIDGGADLQAPVLIGSRCRIEQGTRIGPLTCIGSNTIVESGSQVARSVVFDFTYLGRASEIKGCVLGKNVLVRPRARVFEGAVVGDGCQLGSGSEVAQGIKIWPDKIIEAGASVRLNLVWGLTWHRKIFGSKGIVGLSNIEITPETTAKLGASFGTFLGSKSKMVVARDTLRSSRMLKRSFIAGLLATGATIFNVRAAPAPVTRLAILTSSLDGGVYFGSGQNDLDYALIQFFDERGYNIRLEAQRKVEDILFKEEIHRASSDELSDIFYLPQVYEEYSELVSSLAVGKRIAESKPRLVVDCSSGPTSLTAPQILSSLGCEVISLNAGVGSFSTAALANPSFSNLRDIVTAVGAVAGFSYSLSGENLRIVDETGSFLDGDEGLAVVMEALLTLDSGNIAIPVSSSLTVEQLAEKHGYSARRVKTDPRSLMEAVGSGGIVYGGNDAGEFLVSKKLPFPDALAASMKIIEYLSTRGRRLSKLRKEVYQPRIAKGVVMVPWSERGRIMRKLAMDFGDKRVETLQGVKLLMGDGWVLINPSSDEPVFEIVAESTDVNKAMELLKEFQSRVSDLAEYGSER